MAKPRRTVTEIFRDADGLHYRRVRFADRDRFHYTAGGSHTLEEALNAADPFQEYVWREPTDAGTDIALISDSFKPGSVAERMSEFDPASLRS